MDNYALHWFRRDLRIGGNQALAQSWKEFDGKVLGIFTFDKKFLFRSDFSTNRFQFFLNRIAHLKKELQMAGGDLLVLDQGPIEGFNLLFNYFEKNKIQLPKVITFNRDYEPFALDRDSNLTVLFQQFGIEVKSYRDHLVIEPDELVKDKKTRDGYQVFTPFARKWNQILNQSNFANRIHSQKQGLTFLKDQSREHHKNIFNLTWKHLFGKMAPLQDRLEEVTKLNQKNVSIQIPVSSSIAILQTLENFKKRIDSYHTSRDIPSLDGTSKVSLFLKNGSLTTAQIIQYFNLQTYEKAISSENKYLSELIWREFYYHILYRHPRVENEAFIQKYKNIQWENDPKKFEAWKMGQTGFPIVDAGMRELLQTGWMHNRVRMIVASFLTKDLLIDWKWGEAHFMHYLLDGDLAPNNGGWQWAASTGCDPQPYFRIFNPWSQGLKFDPNGIYIKRFVPELVNVPCNDLHAPLAIKGYPAPIVDHSVQRMKAIKLYKLDY